MRNTTFFSTHETPQNYTTGLLDIHRNLCYNDDSEGKDFTDILTNERVKTMNAIMNKVLSARLYDDYQYEYEFSFSFDWQDESFNVLRTNTGTCSDPISGI